MSRVPTPPPPRILQLGLLPHTPSAFNTISKQNPQLNSFIEKGRFVIEMSKNENYLNHC